MTEYYLTGQVCLNGHKITGQNGDSNTSKFCADCGEATISACPSCNHPIRGDHIFDGDIYYRSNMHVSAFCFACGKPFPWTERAVAAAKDLADEIENMDADDLEKAKNSFIALASDTPQTAVAAARITKLIAKAGPVIGKGLRDIAVSIATDAAKKAMGF